MNFEQRTMPTILCCMCGTPIPSNPSNMCVNCVRSQVDITEGIPKQLTLQYCKLCGRYLNPPSQWLVAELESKELLALCIKKIRGLNKVRLVDAGFVWTEPHSRVVKMKLTVQKEVFTSTILQQMFIVEFYVQTQLCDACTRYNSKDTWNSVCQVRQRVEHKRTFFFLEQVILKHNAHMNTNNVKQTPDGLDFFFNSRSHAMKFVDFLQQVVPIRYKTSDKLISHDETNNTFNYKYTFSIEIVPVCREDMLCLPHRISSSCGSISPLVLCYKVSNILHIIDPFTLQVSDISANVFWATPFRSIASFRDLIEYVIIDIVPLGPVNGKFVLADVTVARTRDLGSNDIQFVGRTHLGHILKPGDSALGYDLATSIVNDADLAPLKGKQLPDFVLVRKAYPEKKTKRQRIWQLKQLEKDFEEDNKKYDEEKEAREMEQFMQDLEQDPEMRQNVNLFKVKNADKIAQQQRQDTMDDMDDGNDDDDIGLEELIEDLNIADE